MTHKGTVTLVTERLTLRRFEMNDADALFRNFYSDPEAVWYSRWEAHSTVETTKEVVSQYVAEYDNANCYNWAIVPSDIGEPIGRIAVSHLDERVSIAVMSFFIGKLWWHRGYTSEALLAVNRFLFEEIKVNRVEGRHDVANMNCGSVMKKCGMRFEGVLRQAGRNSNGIVDVRQYAMLAEDYFGSEKTALL